MTSEKRMSFTSDDLIEQILDGRKTASVEWLDRQGELDEWDSALEVGAVYTVCDSSRRPRCRIRVTSIRLCRWAEIPEWLWRGEVTDSAGEFREAHRDFFNEPAEDFEFAGYEFELVPDALHPHA